MRQAQVASFIVTSWWQTALVFALTCATRTADVSPTPGWCVCPCLLSATVRHHCCAAIQRRPPATDKLSARLSRRLGKRPRQVISSARWSTSTSRNQSLGPPEQGSRRGAHRYTDTSTANHWCCARSAAVAPRPTRTATILRGGGAANKYLLEQQCRPRHPTTSTHTTLA